jgi:hypothetical protein
MSIQHGTGVNGDLRAFLSLSCFLFLFTRTAEMRDGA